MQLRSAALVFANGVAVACAQSTPPPAAIGTVSAAEADTASETSEADAAPEEDASTAEEEPPRFDVEEATEVVSSALGLEPPPAQDPQETAHGLRLVVDAQDPGEPWLFAVANRGTVPYEVVGDPRLLSFDVEVPGKRAHQVCALPAGLVPKHVDDDYLVELAPGEALVDIFDPRLYCFGSDGQVLLVPGAILTPRYGFAPATKSKWKAGKLVTQILPEQTRPFLAESFGEEPPEHGDRAERAEPENPEAANEEKPIRVKRIESRPFALGSEYAEWSRAGLRPLSESPEPIEIDLAGGSDAANERNTTVTIALENTTGEAQRVYFRRELLKFLVIGPDGESHCDPQPDQRAPDITAFLSLAPEKSMSITSRLSELCPNGTFERPGLYLVSAEFAANRDGSEFGLEAFVGNVHSKRAAPIRVRSGALPIYERPTMVKVALSPKD